MSLPADQVRESVSYRNKKVKNVERDEWDEDEKVDGRHRKAGQEQEVVAKKGSVRVVAGRPGQGIGVLII